MLRHTHRETLIISHIFTLLPLVGDFCCYLRGWIVKFRARRARLALCPKHRDPLPVSGRCQPTRSCWRSLALAQRSFQRTYCISAAALTGPDERGDTTRARVLASHCRWPLALIAAGMMGRVGKYLGEKRFESASRQCKLGRPPSLQCAVR